MRVTGRRKRGKTYRRTWEETRREKREEEPREEDALIKDCIHREIQIVQQFAAKNGLKINVPSLVRKERLRYLLSLPKNHFQDLNSPNGNGKDYAE